MRLIGHRFVVGLALAVGAMAAGVAAAGDDEASRRAQLAAERDAVQSRHEAAVRACDDVFAVTACLDQARRERRRELSRIDAEQATLDQAVRQRRAGERRQRIELKQQQAAARLTAPASGPAAPREPRAVRAQSLAAAASAPPRRTTSPEQRAAAAASAASARQATSARRRAEAQAHAQAVQRRNAERAARRAPAPPLPPAPATSAPALR